MSPVFSRPDFHRECSAGDFRQTLSAPFTRHRRPQLGPTRRLWKRADHRQVYGGSTLEPVGGDRALDRRVCREATACARACVEAHSSQSGYGVYTVYASFLTETRRLK
jgi:hypothetical protein